METPARFAVSGTGPDCLGAFINAAMHHHLFDVPETWCEAEPGHMVNHGWRETTPLARDPHHRGALNGRYAPPTQRPSRLGLTPRRRLKPIVSCLQTKRLNAIIQWVTLEVSNYDPDL